MFFRKKANRAKLETKDQTAEEESFLDYQIGDKNNTAKDKSLAHSQPDEEDEATDDGENWLDDDYEEGQLSVDVYQKDDAIVIKSTIAGVSPEDIDISINNDMVTIRGKRTFDESIAEDDYFYQECYWGGFSRSIILPVEITPDKAEAALKNGVLTITLPKADKSKTVSLKVKGKEI